MICDVNIKTAFKSGQIHTKLALNRNIIVYHFLSCSQCLSLVCLRIPLLHDGVVEILVSKEARPKHHGQAHRQHSTHHAEICDSFRGEKLELRRHSSKSPNA